MLDRKTQPLFQKDLTFSLLQPEVQVLPHGKVLFIQGGDQDVVKIECVFHAGKWYEEQPGVSYFTANLLSKGTTRHSSYDITQQLDQLGLHLDISPGYDFTSVSLYGLSRNITQALELFLEMIQTSVFPEHELSQLQNIYVQNLRVNLEKTSYLASREMRAVLFGNSHPYGKDAGLEQIQALAADQLSAFHKKAFNACTVYVSGKLPEVLKKSIVHTFQHLGSQVGSDPVHAATTSSRREHHVSKTGSIQSSIRVGFFSVSRTHDDYAAVLLLNHMLGGFFGSRLMKNIREEKGLTYGIHSSIIALRHASYITIGTDVNNENTGLALAEIQKEVDQLHATPLDGQELALARNHFIGSLQSEMNTPFAHADKIKTLDLFGLPEGYFQELVLKIDSISADTLREVAHRHFQAANSFAVIAG